MKNTSSISIRILSTLALLFYTMLSYGQSTYDVTYTSGTFNGENSWLLWDATTNSELLCDDATAVPGTYSAPVPAGHSIELYLWESFGDGWAGATISLSRQVGPDCPAADLFGPFLNPNNGGGAIGNGTLDDCPGGSPTDGFGGYLAFSTSCGTLIPTLGQWGIIILFLSLGIFGMIKIKSKVLSLKSVKL